MVEIYKRILLHFFSKKQNKTLRFFTLFILYSSDYIYLTFVDEFFSISNLPLLKIHYADSLLKIYLVKTKIIKSIGTEPEKREIVIYIYSNLEY